MYIDIENKQKYKEKEKEREVTNARHFSFPPLLVFFSISVIMMC